LRRLHDCMEDAPQPALDERWEILPASWRDLNALRRVEKVCFPLDVWPLWDLIGVLTLPNIVRLKAVVGEEMIGFIGVDVRPYEKRAMVATVGVLPQYRGRGIGKALMEACEAELNGIGVITLNVRLSNRTAIGMYEKLGYRGVSRWPGYYQDGEDALVMEKRIL
jgi:ribosomal protein S18 acetylase RimI-like enzyme